MKTLLMIMAVMAIPMSAQAATHHRGAPQARASQPKIASTEAGCLPVPRGQRGGPEAVSLFLRVGMELHEFGNLRGERLG